MKRQLFALTLTTTLLVTLSGCADPDAGKEPAREACNTKISSMAPANGINGWNGESASDQLVEDITLAREPISGADVVWAVQGTMPAGSAPWKDEAVLYSCYVHATKSGDVVEVLGAKIVS